MLGDVDKHAAELARSEQPDQRVTFLTEAERPNPPQIVGWYKSPEGWLPIVREASTPKL